MQLPNNQEENFCIKYYPELYNLTSNKSEAVTFDLNQLYELPQDANTCPDEEDIDDLDPNQIALIPTTNKTINGKTNPLTCCVYNRHRKSLSSFWIFSMLQWYGIHKTI